MNKYYCLYCDTYTTTTVKEVDERYPVLGKDIVIKANVRFCDNCGESLWDDQLDSKNLLDAYVKYSLKYGEFDLPEHTKERLKQERSD